MKPTLKMNNIFSAIRSRSTLLSTIVCALIVSGCASAPTKKSLPPVSTYEVLEKPFDEVWAAAVSCVASKVDVDRVEKDSGLITSKRLTFGSSFSGWVTLEKYAYTPKVLMATWSGGTEVTLTFLISPINESRTSLKVTGRFRAFENNVTKSWHTWESNGRYEREYIDEIKSSLGLKPEILETSDARM